MTGSPRRPGACKFYQDLGQTLSEAVAIVARYDCVKDANRETRRVRNKRSETESPDAEIPEAGFLPWDYYWELRLGAKTPQQLADAARARVLAEPVDPGKESQEVRQYRASAAAALAYAQAEDQLKEAQKNRSLNLEKMLTDQRNEADLIGKTGGAAAALRKEYELVSAAKMEAAQRGAEVDSAELANIKAKAAELGKLSDAYNQQKFTFDLNQQNSDARLSPRDQQITTQQRQAGLPEDLNGANAKAAGQSID